GSRSPAPCRKHRHKVPGRAVERVAERGEGTEPDRPGPAVLENRQVRQRDAHLRGEFGQGHTTLLHQPVEVYLDPVLLLRRHHITVSRSARMATPRRTTSATASKMNAGIAHHRLISTSGMAQAMTSSGRVIRISTCAQMNSAVSDRNPPMSTTRPSTRSRR